MRKLIPVAALLLGGCAAFTEHRVGIEQGRLLPCGAWPRCVSSNDPDKHIAPIDLRVPADQAWPKVLEAVAGMPRTRVVESTAGYLRAEIDSPLGWYVDDLELLITGPAKLDVRSTGRIGYYDFQVNRERVDLLRKRLIELGIAQPEP